MSEQCVLAVLGTATQLYPARRYLRRLDVDARGGRGYVAMCDDIRDAMTFADVAEAYAYWRTRSKETPTRPDGQPNRPLTAYTVEIQPLAMEAGT